MKKVLRWLFRPQRLSQAEIIHLIRVQSALF